MPARAKKKFIHNRENSDFEGFGQVGKGVKAASLLSKIFDNQVFQPDFLYSLLVEILSNKMELERVSGVFRACIQCARAHYGRRTGQDRTGDQQRSTARAGAVAGARAQDGSAGAGREDRQQNGSMDGRTGAGKTAKKRERGRAPYPPLSMRGGTLGRWVARAERGWNPRPLVI
jgi:hypothetical protein